MTPQIILPTPEEIKSLLPLDEESKKKIDKWKQEVSDIVHGKSDKKILIIGPCSADFKDTLLEYAKKLKKISDQVEDKIRIIMRVYNSKPRTTVGRKGMLYNGEFGSGNGINEGIKLSRELMIEITKIGLPIANELLYTDMIPYYNDLLTYIAIGARNSENQQHREVCSGLNIPVGFKNPTSGDWDITVNNVIAVRSAQQALLGGKFYQTPGNKDGHIILRGSKFNGLSKPNIEENDIDDLEIMMKQKGIDCPYIIDINHDNSGQNGSKQPEILEKTLNLNTNNHLIGWMSESYLLDGNQKISDKDISHIVKGLSVTDSCLGIENTEKMVMNLYAYGLQGKIENKPATSKEANIPIGKLMNVSLDEENTLIGALKKRNDAEAQRICRMYEMPDLTRTEGNPVNLIVEKILHSDQFQGFDVIKTPEVVGVHETFDIFNFPKNHPARKKSDTYFVTDDKILRTHTTVMRYYYLSRPEIQEKLKKTGELKALSFGKVYRRDEIDAKHYPIFHQIDGLYLVEKSKKIIRKNDLKNMLIDMARNIFGKEVEFRILDDTFPYTKNSVQMEINLGDEVRLELLGSGVVLPKVLENLGIDSKKYNGRAFGPGIERLAMAKMQIPDIRIFWSQDPRITQQRGSLEKKYQEISKYPGTYRDISFVISKEKNLNDYYDLIRDLGENLVEEVLLLDKYENEKKFGKDKISYTFRIVYRSHEKTLQNDEINNIQEKIREITEKELSAELR